MIQADVSEIYVPISLNNLVYTWFKLIQFRFCGYKSKIETKKGLKLKIFFLYFHFWFKKKTFYNNM